MRPDARGGGWFLAAAALTAAAVLALLWALIEGEDVANAIDDLPLLLLGAAAGAALYGWRETLREAAADRQRAAEERAKAEAIAKRLETERRWRQELRAQLDKLQHEVGVLGRTNDVPALVLKTAMELVGAQKGMLLDRK